jgi:hypothetical protein
MEFHFNGCMETSSSTCRRKYSGAKTSSTPIILVLMELIGDILPPGVVNIVNGLVQS